MTSVIDIRPSIDPIPLVRALAGLEVQGFYGADGAPTPLDTADLVAEFTHRYSLLIISRLLGFPVDDEAEEPLGGILRDEEVLRSHPLR